MYGYRPALREEMRRTREGRRESVVLPRRAGRELRRIEREILRAIRLLRSRTP